MQQAGAIAGLRRKLNGQRIERGHFSTLCRLAKEFLRSDLFSNLRTFFDLRSSPKLRSAAHRGASTHTKKSHCKGFMKNLLITAVLLAVLSGCALLRSQVSVSHQLPKDPSGTTYAMVPFKEQEGKTQHKAYEEVVRQALNAKGFRETTINQAQTVVFFAYGIGTGREVFLSYPIIGQTGVETCTSTSCAYSYPWPTYGVVGTRETRETEYTRVLRLVIVDRQALAGGNIKKLYEGEVVSSGFSDQLAQVLPMMVKALFEDFPGQSGSTRTSSQVTHGNAIFGTFL